jgi:hypothetical protein
VAAKKQNFTILQGETFQRIIRWETQPYIYKPISAITNSAPVSITSVGHGLVSGWRVAVVSVKGMSEINAKHSPPRESEFKAVTRTSPDVITLNEVNSADFSPYISGGYLQFFTPVDLTGYSAQMDIKDRVGGTVLLTLGSDVLIDPKQRIVLDMINNTISLRIEAEDTESDVLMWTRGVYDLEMTSPTGAVTRVFTGNVAVSKEVTT